MHKPIKFVYAVLIIAIIGGGIAFLIINKPKQDKSNLLNTVTSNYIYSGTYEAYEGKGEIIVSQKDSNTMQIQGTTTYLKPGNSNNDNYKGQIKGDLVFQNTYMATYTDPTNKECAINLKFYNGDSLNVNGASENCDALLSSFDGIYYKLSDKAGK